MVRVPRNLDRALYHFPVLVEFLSVSDPTLILLFELLESFISAYLYSAVSIGLIRQETISLAIMNHLFRHPVEGRLTFGDISPVLIRTKRMHSLQSTLFQSPLISEIERARSSGKISKLSF